MLNIVYQIQNSNLSLEKISQKSGIPVESLQHIGSEIREPTLNEVRVLAKVFKTSVEFLLEENSKYQEINVLFRKAVGDRRDYSAVDRFSHMIGNSFNLLNDYQKDQSLLSLFSVVENTGENAQLLAYKFRDVFLKSDY